MKLDLETKTKAVGEVFLGTGTLEDIGVKYGISPSYLSTLASRAKRSMLRKGLGAEVKMIDQEARLAAVIREKISDLEEVEDKISTIGAELEGCLG
jgi:transposase-like protein